MNKTTPPPLQQNVLKISQMIVMAQALGVVMFAVVVLGVYASAKGPFNVTPELLAGFRVMTYVQLGLYALVGFIRGAVTRGILASRLKAMPREITEDEFASRFPPVYQVSLLVQIALIEGPALFALVVCFIGAANVLHVLPAYWVNLIPVVAGLIHLTLLFPTEDRYQAMLRNARQLQQSLAGRS